MLTIHGEKQTNDEEETGGVLYQGKIPSGSRYHSGRSKDWLKFKNSDAPAVRREAEEDWGK
jgi:ATP-dependent DNA ligase